VNSANSVLCYAHTPKTKMTMILLFWYSTTAKGEIEAKEETLLSTNHPKYP